jgi:hypothetical protein
LLFAFIQYTDVIHISEHCQIFISITHFKFFITLIAIFFGKHDGSCYFILLIKQFLMIIFLLYFNITISLFIWLFKPFLFRKYINWFDSKMLLNRFLFFINSYRSLNALRFLNGIVYSGGMLNLLVMITCYRPLSFNRLRNINSFLFWFRIDK